MCCVWCGLWKMKHVLCMDVDCGQCSMCCVWVLTVDNEACVVYDVDCGQ